MTRRTLTIALHWANMLLLILLVAAGPLPALAWAFVACALLMVTLAVFGGLLNGPGPKLEGALRAAHPWLSRAMYAGLAAVALITMARLLALWSSPITLQQLYFYLLGAASLHGVFHLWRHTALGDGALKRITPRFMHDAL
ncbi:hypothetical protein [Aestuariivita boseongensis]|uniref:hypothetical protein n=1 Tax=Aestuariivita boseongensis TaxID=1470562 RepID=UPI0006827D8B|nr:hypothetical protein [Aestuariivita boseongensis]